MKKKGQVSINNGPNVIISLAVLALITAAMLIGLRALYTNTAGAVLTGTDLNSTFTAINATAISFNGTDHPEAITCGNVKIANSTNVDKTASFTIDGCTATLKDISQNNTGHTANYTYTYNQLGPEHTQLNNTALGLGNVSAQIPTIGTMMSIALVLGIVFAIFMFRRGGSGGL